MQFYGPVLPTAILQGTATAAVTDTLAPSETFVKRVDKLFADAVALTEARLISISKTVGETVGLAEGFSAVKTTFKDIGETLGFTEGFLKQVNKTVGETVALTESRLLSVGRGFAETVGLAEGFTAVKTSFKDLGDTLGLTELFTKLLQRGQAETVGLGEQFVTEVIPAGGGGPLRGIGFSYARQGHLWRGTNAH